MTTAKGSMRRKQSRTSRPRAQARVNEFQVLDLRLKGLSLRAIGKRLGVCHATAYKAMSRVLAKLEAASAEKAEELRRIETERLDLMLEALLPKATNKRNPNGAAADRVLKIMERRAKLWGLDAPKKFDHRMTHEDWLDEMGGDE